MTSHTLALAESPAQLLNVVEWADQCAPGESIRIVVLAPTNPRSRAQLRHMMALARAAGHQLHWNEARLGGAEVARTVRSLMGELSGIDRLIIGDPFSGVIQVILGLSRARSVVLVDDGTSTLEFARQWQSSEPLTRWHRQRPDSGRRRVITRARDQLSVSVKRHLASSTKCAVTLFTCLPVELPQARTRANTYRFTRGQHPIPAIKAGADLIGTSLVETGVVDSTHYLEGVSSIAERFGADRYFAHRKEADDKLRAIADLGLEIVRPELPLELVARQGPIGHTVISFPSTVVHTLPAVLVDAGVEVLVCDIADSWYAPRAPVRSASFLNQVTTTARERYGLAAAVAG